MHRYTGRKRDELWPNTGNFTILPDDLLLHQHQLDIDHRDMGILVAILSHGRTDEDWPCFRMSWAQIADATNATRKEMRLSVRRLDAHDVIHIEPGTGNRRTLFDFRPLQYRLAVLDKASSAYALLLRQRRRDLNAQPQPTLTGLDDPRDPAPADLLAAYDKLRAKHDRPKMSPDQVADRIASTRRRRHLKKA